MKLVFLTFLMFSGVFCSAKGEKIVKLPSMRPRVLQHYAVLGSLANRETSGIVKSRTHKNTFWVHNDSGNEPRIYAVNQQGKLYKSKKNGTARGVKLSGAVNIDWEDIAADDRGNLIIADFGNNCNCRKDLVFYIITEPDTSQALTSIKSKIFFKYPDQKSFPAAKGNFNFDAEAVFYARGKIFVLSKNRSDSFTKLYRLDETAPDEVNTLTYMDQFDIKGMVTAADASEDGRRIAVLTYNAVWMFETRKNEGDWFGGKIAWLPIVAVQAEGICFNGKEELIVSDEAGGRLYRVALKDLSVVKK